MSPSSSSWSSFSVWLMPSTFERVVCDSSMSYAREDVPDLADGVYLVSGVAHRVR